MSVLMKMVTWGSGESVFKGGVIVCQFGWEQVPLTSISSLSVSKCFGTRHPHHGSWIRRMEASVVCRRVMSASCWQFMFADRIMRLSGI